MKASAANVSGVIAFILSSLVILSILHAVPYMGPCVSGCQVGFNTSEHLSAMDFFPKLDVENYQSGMSRGTY